MVTCKQYKQLMVNNSVIVYCMVHVLSCVGIVATVWLTLTVPFSTVVMECAKAPAIPSPSVHPPMTKIDPGVMVTTATQSLGVEREANLSHLFFDISRMATSDVVTP